MSPPTLARMASPPDPTDPKHLAALRLALVRVHQALLQNERRRYERLHGRVEDGFALLNLAAHDPWFAWLRPMAQLIVQFDERLEQAEPLAPAAGRELVEDLRALVAPTGETEEFHVQYREALQASPEVVMLHAALLRQLNGGRDQAR